MWNTFRYLAHESGISSFLYLWRTSLSKCKFCIALFTGCWKDSQTFWSYQVQCLMTLVTPLHAVHDTLICIFPLSILMQKLMNIFCVYFPSLLHSRSLHVYLSFHIFFFLLKWHLVHINLFKKSDMASLTARWQAGNVLWIYKINISQNKNFHHPLWIKYYILGIHKQPEHQ